MKKKMCGVLAALTAATVVLQGCGSLNAQDAMKKAYDNTMGNTVALSVDGEIRMATDTEALLAASGVSDEAATAIIKLLHGDTLDLDFGIEGELENGKSVSHMTTIMSMSLFGFDQTSKTETYSADQVDRIFTYKSSDGGEWKLSVSPLQDKGFPLFIPEELSKCFSFREIDKKTVTEDVDGKTCYVLEGALTEDVSELTAYLNSILSLNEGFSGFAMNDLDAAVVCYVDKKDLRPVRLEMDLKSADFTLIADTGSFDVALDGTTLTVDYEKWGIDEPVVPKVAAKLTDSTSGEEPSSLG